MFRIYLTQVIADLTEGRGPMLNDKAFARLEDAEAYIDRKEGVMGSLPKEGRIAYSRKHARTYQATADYGGSWDIVPLNVHETYEEAITEEEKRLRANALSKLTLDEKRVLGVL